MSDKQEQYIHVIETAAPKERPRPTGVLVPALLFAATVVTTVIAGALFEGADIMADPVSLAKGLPFSAALLAILGTHEFGHYFASRRHGVRATLPFFIPAPPIPFMIGTFGAVIKMKSPISTKSALVDIGAAGPLSGFVVAVVVVVVGLSQSTVMDAPSDAVVVMGLGSSLIFSLLAYVTVGPIAEGKDIFLNSVAFAGWIGLFITSINLLPIGQLDGGHILYSIAGRFHRRVSKALVVVLVVLGVFTWPGWVVWAILVSVIGLGHPPVFNEREPLDPARRRIAIITLIVFVLTFIPTPFYIQ